MVAMPAASRSTLMVGVRSPTASPIWFSSSDSSMRAAGMAPWCLPSAAYSSRLLPQSSTPWVRRPPLLPSSALLMSSRSAGRSGGGDPSRRSTRVCLRRWMVSDTLLNPSPPRSGGWNRCSSCDDLLFLVRLLYSCARSLSSSLVNSSDHPDRTPRYAILLSTDDSKTALMVSADAFLYLAAAIRLLISLRDSSRCVAPERFTS